MYTGFNLILVQNYRTINYLVRGFVDLLEYTREKTGRKSIQVVLYFQLIFMINI